MMLACGSSMPPPLIDGFLRTLRPKSSTSQTDGRGSRDSLARAAEFRG